MPPRTSTPRFRPVIRVFVSSTFNDLKAERNALQAQAFPKLEQLCAQKGFQFQAIDLRWGVSSEAGLDHRTMRICFDELRRAQEISPEPNFLVLLGDRYGWRPLPEAISAMEFEALKKAATTDHPDDTDKHRSDVKDQKSESGSPSVIRKIREIRGQELDPLAVLDAWYRCDENILLAEPPETDPDRIPLNYILQPRTRNLGDGRDYTRRKDDPTKDTQDWLVVQQVLWRLINTAFPADARWFDGVDWARHLAEVNDPQHPKRAIPQIARFQASATEQEIWCGALSAANAERHVIACFREISNRGDFPIIEVKDFFDRTDSGEFDEAAVARQTALKEAIRLRLGENKPVPIPFTRLKRENSKVLVDASEADTQAFCDAVLARFRPIIERQIEEYWNKSAKGSTERSGRELEIERDEHRRFGRERGGSESFVGRETELEAIRDYLRSESRLPLVVHGSSGCGKTALMARAAGEFQRAEVGGQRSEVIVRFIGVTPRSSDVRSLLGSLCQELRLRHPREGELPTDTKALREELHEQFRAATPEQPLILFLDALDQLSDADGGRLLNWIPAGPLPANMKLVVSCLSDRAEGDPAGQPCAELRRRRLPAESFINLDVLSEVEARTLLFDRWLHQAGRTVSAEQCECIEQRLASPVCRQPIYLKLLFEEARFWRSYDAAPGLGEGVSALLGQLFERLSRPANHGPLLVERVLGYLAASRHGLAENETLEVLFADRDYKAKLNEDNKRNLHELPASATRIPIAIWSRLRFDLAPYLTERAAVGANVLTFYHRQVAEWVQEHSAKSSAQSWQPHERLADYFVGCAQGTDPGKRWETLAVRGFAECVFHLVKAGQHDRAASLLTTFPFLLHKTRVGLLEGMFDDYEMFRLEAAAEHVRAVEMWSTFFREKAHILRRGNDEWPAHKSLLQLAVEHADDSPLTLNAEQWLSENRCDWLWLRRAGGRPKNAVMNRCLRTFEHASILKGARVLTDGRIVSWGMGSLRFWDLQSGECVANIQGLPHWVSDALELNDGRVLSWLSVRWAERGGALMELEPLLPLHVDPDWGAHAAKWSESEEMNLQVFDARNGQCLAILVGHTSNVTGALELPNGRVLSWSCDKSLRIWDGSRGVLLHTLKGHTDKVNGAMALAEEKILSWSDDHTLRLWDGQNGVLLHTYEGHKDKVNGATRLANGRLLSWSEDASLRMWHVQAGVLLWTFQVTRGRVDSVQMLPKAGILSCWSDATLRVWDGNIDSPLNALEQRTEEGKTYVWVNSGAEILSDGRILSWTGDCVLRLWDAQRYVLLRTIKGATGGLEGIKVLGDGRVLAWFLNGTLQLWDMQSGVSRSTLKGHADAVRGVHELDGGRVLSWSKDGTLRLWDVSQRGTSAVFDGHRRVVAGARMLVDGRILSWSHDETLRLWDGLNGSCLAVLEGHAGDVNGALALDDGRLLSWSSDETLRLWDGQSGSCLEIIPEKDVETSHPELAVLRNRGEQGASTAEVYRAQASGRTVRFEGFFQSQPFVCWQADHDCCVEETAPNGTIIVTQEDHQVCILHLYCGNSRLTLAEMDGLLSKPSADGSAFPLVRMIAFQGCPVWKSDVLKGLMQVEEHGESTSTRGESILINLTALLKEADILYRRGRLEQALALLEDQEQISRSAGDQSSLAACLIRQAEILLEQGGRRDNAIGKCDEAAAIFTSLNMPEALAGVNGLKLRLRTGVSLGLVRLCFWIVGTLLMLLAVGLLWINQWFWVISGPLLLCELFVVLCLIPSFRTRVLKMNNRSK